MLVTHFIDIRCVQLGGDIFIAGLQLIHQLHIQRAAAKPSLARGDFGNIDYRALLANKVLKQLVGVFNIFGEFLSVLVGIFTKHRQGALVFPGGDHLEIYIVFLQDFVEIWQLRNHANGADYRERRRQNFIRDTGHHIAATGGDFVHTHGQGNVSLADARQLAGGQAVAVHHAAGTFQAHQYFVGGPRQTQYGGDFFAQTVGRRGLDIAVEVEHIKALFLGILLTVSASFGRFFLRR